MSERYRPKQLLRARIQQGPLMGVNHTDPLYEALVESVLAPEPVILCRLHDQPWQQCTLCSRSKAAR
jgi:hypothetical protein